MSHIATEAPATHVKSQVLVEHPGFKVVRVQLPGGESLPSHLAHGTVTIIVADGEGHVTIGDTSFAAEPGVVIDVPAGAPHGIFADEDLDVVLVQGLSPPRV